MNGQPCSRKWQVEAARDGRLQGKDLDSALRHRATCGECMEEVRALASLAQDIARLPERTRDPMTLRRSRQRLMASMNQSLLEPPRARVLHQAMLAIALGSAASAALWFGVGRPFAGSNVARGAGSVVEVRAELGARWSEHTEPELDRVDFSEGAASFTVHPHAGRRVLVRLPDGELDDEGTVFEVSVTGGQTRRIAVSEGRVSIHLRGRPNFGLGAGQAWESETAAPSADTAASRMSSALPNPQALAVNAGAPGVVAVPNRVAAPQWAITSASARAPLASPAANQTQFPAHSTDAEDDAYLGIVALLKQGKSADARVQAKRYLLRFPNGFRRVEVLNIATRAADDAGVVAGTH